VVAIDADINRNLALALGHDGAPPRPLGADLAWLKDHLRGDNLRIATADAMIKTTPPGRGWRLLDTAADAARERSSSTWRLGTYFLTGGSAGGSGLLRSLRDDPRVRRVLDDPAAIGLWLALTLAGIIAAFVATNAVWAVLSWAVGGVAAFVLVAIKARRPPRRP
jgi:hypothetical protein